VHNEELKFISTEKVMYSGERDRETEREMKKDGHQNRVLLHLVYTSV
jgi:hypothetical protein